MSNLSSKDREFILDTDRRMKAGLSVGYITARDLIVIISKLEAALEKCKEQRKDACERVYSWMDQFHKIDCVNSDLRKYDNELTAILELCMEKMKR